MASLKKLQIKNYRSIKDSGEIPITKLFALIGRNNTGKSTFLKAIQLLFGEIKEIEDSDFHKDTGDAIEITGTIERWDNGEKKAEIIQLTCEKGGKPKYSVDGAEKAHPTYTKAIPSLLVIPDRRDSGEFSTGGNKTTLLKRILSEKRVVDENGLNTIAEQLVQAKRAEAAEISKILTEKFQDIAQEVAFEVRIEPDVDVDKSTTHTSALVDRDVPNAPIVGMTECGTGIQSMYLFALLDTYGDISEKSNEGILLIEEPEVYLHPDYQRRMFDAMRKIASDNQVIFSTHSPIMISEIWLTESVRQVRLVDGETQIEEIRVEDVISELGIRYEDVLNPKLTIFVEGKSDIVFYEKLGLKPSNSVTFITTDGFRAMHYFAYIKILSSENVGSTFIAVADSDGEETEVKKNKFREEIKKQFKDVTKKMKDRVDGADCLFILSKYSIESYFLNHETLIAAFPKIDADDLKTLLTHYDAVYTRRLTEVADGNGLENFRKYARPKLLFDRTERRGDTNPNFEQGYYAFWDDNKDFQRVREQLLAQCEVLGSAWFSHVLAHADLERFEDLTSLREKVLKLA
jgi:putative ATP-dependent endonuclease of OLD family